MVLYDVKPYYCIWLLLAEDYYWLAHLQADYYSYSSIQPDEWYERHLFTVLLFWPADDVIDDKQPVLTEVTNDDMTGLTYYWWYCGMQH